MQRYDDITIDQARELVSDAALWPLVRDFLWDFAAQIHPSWIEDVISGGDAENTEKNHLCASMNSAALRENKSPRVNAWILERLGVQPCFHTFPKDDWSRLLLLDGATLESMVKWLGALACAEELRKVTGGATVRQLRAALPGVYPEVFGYTMYFKSLTVGQFDGLTVDKVFATGLEMLSSVISGLPEQLKLRFKLKLPKPLDGQMGNPSNRQTVKPSNLQLLMKLRFPEAYSLCC